MVTKTSVFESFPPPAHRAAVDALVLLANPSVAVEAAEMVVPQVHSDAQSDYVSTDGKDRPEHLKYQRGHRHRQLKKENQPSHCDDRLHEPCWTWTAKLTPAVRGPL